MTTKEIKSAKKILLTRTAMNHCWTNKDGNSLHVVWDDASEDDFYEMDDVYEAAGSCCVR